MMSKQVLSISTEGESTASLGGLFQWPITLKVKEFFLMFIFSPHHTEKSVAGIEKELLRLVMSIEIPVRL